MVNGMEREPSSAWMSRADRLALRSLDPARPEVGAESGFEPSEGGKVSPYPAGEDVADGCVVDARGRFGGPQTSPSKSVSQPEGEEPHDLGGWVVARPFRPVGAIGVRGWSRVPGHPSSVEPIGSPLVDCVASDVTPAWETGGAKHRDIEDTDPVARRIENFTPDMPDRYWAVIEDFVRAAVADAQPSTVYSAHNLLSAVSRHVLWCWQTAGLELDRKVVFDRWTIAEYIVKGCPTLTPASRGNRRSQLLRVAEALLGPEGSPARLAPLPASDPVRPYSPSELIALRSWAAGQSTPTRRRDAATLLALAAGGGLAVEDIAGVTAGMVAVDGEGVLIAVPGRRARLVPVLADWEGPLIDASRSISPDRPIFGEGRTTSNKNFVSNFVGKSSGVCLKPSAQRLRATWIVHHLAVRTPVVPFMAAAGVQSLEALTRYLRFVPGVGPTEAREALRGQLRGGVDR